VAQPSTLGAAGHAVIVGCGIMGCDIAALFLSGGWDVTAVEPDRDSWPSRCERVDASRRQLASDRQEHAQLTLVETVGQVDYGSVAVVIEAAPEQIELKRRLFRELDALVPSTVPIASNASALRITDIAEGCRTKHRMANLHFFMPAHLVPGVEVVRGEMTDADTCDRLADIMASLGHKPIRVARDVPGFLANRIQHALMREAWAVIDEGLASPDDVDMAVRYAFGFRYISAGPILQKELAGLDPHLMAARTIYPTLCNDDQPSALLSRLVSENKLGAKTGQGLREWPPERIRDEQARSERLLLAASRLLRDEG